MEEEYFPEGHEDCDYMVGMSIDDIHLLYYSVQETIRVWPGAPARPVEEHGAIGLVECRHQHGRRPCL